MADVAQLFAMPCGAGTLLDAADGDSLFRGVLVLTRLASPTPVIDVPCPADHLDSLAGCGRSYSASSHAVVAARF